MTGNGRGEVHVFEFCNGKVSFRRTDKVQGESITQMCSRRNILATGSPSGTVRVWRIKHNKAVKVCCFKTPCVPDLSLNGHTYKSKLGLISGNFRRYEECVTGMGVWEGCILVTYGSGLFRIFHLQTRKLLVKVAAHSRWIGSMDLLAHHGESLLLTVAEDDAVLIWKLTMEDAGVPRRLSLNRFTNIKNKIKSIQRNKPPKRKQPKVANVYYMT